MRRQKIKGHLKLGHYRQFVSLAGGSVQTDRVELLRKESDGGPAAVRYINPKPRKPSGGNTS